MERTTTSRELKVLTQTTYPTPVRPPRKWAGGKRWQLPYLYKIFQQHRHRRLVEPFCGWLVVTLGLLPKKALLNDINQHLINFYKQIQKGLRITVEMANDKELYYRHRDEFNKLVSGLTPKTSRTASLFYYLNRTGYNGLCRFNQKGGFNVPFGKYSQINYTVNFYDYKTLFSNWEFIGNNFDEIPLHPDDFVYADPPYDVEFTQGGWYPSKCGRGTLSACRHGRQPLCFELDATTRPTMQNCGHGSVTMMHASTISSGCGGRTALCARAATSLGVGGVGGWATAGSGARAVGCP